VGTPSKFKGLGRGSNPFFFFQELSPTLSPTRRNIFSSFQSEDREDFFQELFAPSVGSHRFLPGEGQLSVSFFFDTSRPLCYQMSGGCSIETGNAGFPPDIQQS